MATRRTASPRERILSAALTVFSQRGVGATSVQDVADAARMSKQALMHHFRTKDLLRDGVFELVALRLREQFPEVAAELVSRSHDRYRRLLGVVLHRFAEQPQLTRFLVFELLERPAAVMAWLKEEAAPWLGLVRGVVEQSGEQRAFDADAHVAVIGALMLAQSALIPSRDRRWRTRIEAATLKLMVLGSHLG